MERRSFLKTAGALACGSVLFPGLVSCSGQREPVRFGVVTDLHFARKEKIGSRYYEESLEKLKMALKVFEDQDLDFIIELGDFKDQGNEPEKRQTLAFLDEIEATFQSFKGDAYHVLGNHDMDSISKGDFLAHIVNPGIARDRSYYSFIKKGVKFIVLDANYRKDQSDYDCGNYNWMEALIPDHERTWLRQELKEGSGPVVVFVHQLLDVQSLQDPGCRLNKGLFVTGAEEVNRMLADSGRVLAVLQGHHHKGFYSLHDRIHYFTLKGMIEDRLPDHNPFAVVEIAPDGDILLDGYVDCPDKIMRRK